MKLPCPFGLAPMAGYTDEVFRKIAYKYGACFAYTEMISAKSILKAFENVRAMLPKDESMTAVQLLGNDPMDFVRAVRKIENASWIDINAGCPVKKVIKKGMGGALLKDIAKLKEIIRALKENFDLKVSVKTRMGWDRDESDRIYEELVLAGADLVAIHTRTVEQGFKGKADWKALSKIRERPVPLLISGDVFSPEDAIEALKISGADGVLVARGAIGNPWIFSQIESLSKDGSYGEPSPFERLEVFRFHIVEETRLKGERKGVIEMRKFVSGYTRDLPKSHTFRREFMKMEDLKDVLSLLKDYEEEIRRMILGRGAAGRGIAHERCRGKSGLRGRDAG